MNWPQLTTSIACTALLASVSIPAVASKRWQEVADASLLTALQRAHPHVTRWSVEPILGSGQLSRLQQLEPSQAVPLVLGARSAIRLSGAEGTTPTKSATVWFAVTGMQKALAARSRIEAGSMVEPNLAAEAELNVLALGCRPLTSAEELRGMRAKRSFAQGAGLCADAFEPRPAVARGETVTVRAVAGLVTITAKGIAMKDASLGEVLEIKNPTNRRRYRAAVTGVREVTVHD